MKTPRNRDGSGAVLLALPCGYLLLDAREHVTGGKDEVLVGAVLDLGAAVLGEDDGVTLLDVQRQPLAVLEPAGADGENGALLGLLLGGVRDHDAGRRGLLGFQHRHDDAVLERLDVDFGGRGHDLPPPTFGTVDGWWRVACRRGVRRRFLRRRQVTSTLGRRVPIYDGRP